ncbi:MAG: hypothetical protein GC190_11215 [Alphaproteobacteria bacterium]|nr:hypothetical protein [Alphaproteobacteria bacterium]
MRPLSLSVFLVATVAVPAFAASAALEETGLPGTTWAIDCSKPPTTSNYYLTYSVNKDGQLVETLKDGNKDKPRSIRNLQNVSKEWLLYTLDDSDGEAVNILTFTDSQGRKKSWWSVGNGGTVYIIDGKFPDGNGSPPWFTQCK